MDVDVMLAEEVRVNPVPLRIRTRPGQRRGHRLLHDLSQLSGHRELLPTAHAAGFNEHDVSAHWRPHKSDCYSRLLDALFNLFLRAELWYAQILANDFWRNHHLFRVAFGEFARLLSRNRRNLAFEVAHAGFSREAV